MLALDLVLPGDPATATGGYLYDRRIIEGLAGLGWDTAVHALAEDFPLASTASLAAARNVLKAMPAGRTVVIDGLALADLGPILAQHARRLRLVALVHHPVADETGLASDVAERLHLAERRAWETVERVIVTSWWTARRLTDDGVPADRIRVVEPGTDRVGPAGRRPMNPDALGPKRLLCVATLTERKGHAVLLEALARCKDRSWRLDCVGSLRRDPATAAAFRARAERLGLAERIALRGELSREALDECYLNADLFVLPSFLEGYGMALAEALAHGVPVVSTNVGAIPETVGDAGLLVPPGDVDALAAALARVLDDPALHAALTQRADAIGTALPTWADASRRFAAAVAELTEAGSKASG